MDYDMKDLLEEIIKRGATDLHLTVAAPPMFRKDGRLEPSNYDPLSPEQVKKLVYSILNDEQKKKFEMTKELDLSFGVPGLSRFRANVFHQRGQVACAIRTIPFKIRSFKQLGLPPVIAEMANKQKGLVLVTGPTGCGKSTTLAAIIDKIDQERKVHIVTIEDPIEYLFKHKRAIVNQRQIGSDTDKFSTALKYILRQDPDVVMIGEMRDRETMESALNVSETGHLTLATLHTNSAAESISRIVDTFPPEKHSQVRAQISFVIVGIITQNLIPKISGGRALAVEILYGTPAVKALIRDGRGHQIYSHLQAGFKYGMVTMNQSLYKLYMEHQISLDNAMTYSRLPKELEEMIQKKVLILH
ncbi:MAG: type IV pilus twitching motility protein PilT [candidate division WOR-3 bacterium]|nr:type IV pilus twitching motility protein PilT [candidate division WOR-3 bacterium]